MRCSHHRRPGSPWCLSVTISALSRRASQRPGMRTPRLASCRCASQQNPQARRARCNGARAQRREPPQQCGSSAPASDKGQHAWLPNEWTDQMYLAGPIMSRRTLGGKTVTTAQMRSLVALLAHPRRRAGRRQRCGRPGPPALAPAPPAPGALSGDPRCAARVPSQNGATKRVITGGPRRGRGSQVPIGSATRQDVVKVQRPRGGRVPGRQQTRRRVWADQLRPFGNEVEKSSGASRTPSRAPPGPHAVWPGRRSVRGRWS
jgi:hypothetical protein